MRSLNKPNQFCQTQINQPDLKTLKAILCLKTKHRNRFLKNDQIFQVNNQNIQPQHFSQAINQSKPSTSFKQQDYLTPNLQFLPNSNYQINQQIFDAIKKILHSKNKNQVNLNQISKSQLPAQSTFNSKLQTIFTKLSFSTLHPSKNNPQNKLNTSPTNKKENFFKQYFKNFFSSISKFAKNTFKITLAISTFFSSPNSFAKSTFQPEEKEYIGAIFSGHDHEKLMNNPKVRNQVRQNAIDLIKKLSQAEKKQEIQNAKQELLESLKSCNKSEIQDKSSTKQSIQTLYKKTQNLKSLLDQDFQVEIDNLENPYPQFKTNTGQARNQARTFVINNIFKQEIPRTPEQLEKLLKLKAALKLSISTETGEYYRANPLIKSPPTPEEATIFMLKTFYEFSNNQEPDALSPFNTKIDWKTVEDIIAQIIYMKMQADNNPVKYTIKSTIKSATKRVITVTRVESGKTDKIVITARPGAKFYDSTCTKENSIITIDDGTSEYETPGQAAISFTNLWG